MRREERLTPAVRYDARPLAHGGADPLRVALQLEALLAVVVADRPD